MYLSFSNLKPQFSIYIKANKNYDFLLIYDYNEFVLFIYKYTDIINKFIFYVS